MMVRKDSHEATLTPLIPTLKPSFQTDAPKRPNEFLSSEHSVIGMFLNSKDATGKLAPTIWTPATEWRRARL